MTTKTLDAAYFEEVYAESEDPWAFASSSYEREKYASTIALLGTRRYPAAFEIGCSIGILSADLATRCDSLLAVDINARALDAARSHNAPLPNVTFEQMSVPRDFPEHHFDLIVVSEVAYYWSDADLALARERIARAAAGGVVSLVHFLPRVPDYVRDGDAVHDFFLADPRFRVCSSKRAERYRIDVCAIVSE